MLALKENQGRLYEDVRDLFEGAEEFGFEGVPHDYATTLNKGHGRLERRECRVISGPDCLDYLSTGREWPNLRSVVRVTVRRETASGVTVQPSITTSDSGRGACLCSTGGVALLMGASGPLVA